MKYYEQLALKSMPRGIARTVALLDAPPELFEKKLSLKFEHSRDDLDELEGALIKLDTGQFFALIYHLNAPVKGTEVIISETSVSPTVDLDTVLSVLQLADVPVIWRHPNV